jgi:hypothetical protein
VARHHGRQAASAGREEPIVPGWLACNIGVCRLLL